MRYDTSIIEQVTSLNDVVEIISGYVSLKKAGRSFKGLCPFHTEKTPSFHVNPDKQIFHCFGCGVGGDVISFVQKIENSTFPEALEQLADRVHFELPRKNFVPTHKREETESLNKVYEMALQFYQKNYKGPAGGRAQQYLANRGFDPKTLETFEVGYAPDEWRGLSDTLLQSGFREGILLSSGLVSRSSKGSCYDLFRGRILFPIRNPQGKLIGFGGRVIVPEGKPKYLNSPETDAFKKGRELFALSLAKRNIGSAEPRLLIVEGYLDCVRLHQAGFTNAVATLGTALTEDHVRLIRRYADEAVLIFDGDGAGVTAALRSLDVFLEEGFPVKVVALEGGLDPDDAITKKGKEYFQEKLNQAQDLFEFKLEVLLAKYPKRDSLSLLKITSNCLDDIAKVSNEILRNHYLKKLSSRLNVDESSLRKELGKLQQKSHRGPMTAEKGNPPSQSAPLKKEEVHLLYLLAESIGVKWMEKISEVFFTHPACLEAFSILKQTRKELPEDSCLLEFLRRLENSPLKKEISQLSFFDWKEDGQSRALQDCVRKIEQSLFLKEKQALTAKIRHAEEKGELDRVQAYLKDFQQLRVRGKG